MFVTWTEFRKRCGEKSKVALEIDLKKHQNELENYVTRLEIQENIERFLETDDTFLAIVGDSGMGKTCLLYETMKLLYETDHAFLVYNAPDLHRVGNIVDKVELHLKQYLKIDANNPFVRLDELARTRDRLLIIGLDGINESNNYKEIIMQLESSPQIFAHSWIKVIMTSRPHVWQLVRSQGTGRRRYYYSRENNEYYLTLGKFTTDEAALSYEAYRKLFHFTGPSFRELPPHIQQRLHDPLLLRLVTEVSSEKPLLHEISALDIDIVPQYSQYLRCVTGQLRSDDIAFLQDYISPLMYTKATCKSLVSSEDIFRITPQDDRNLCKERLSRLLKTGILVETTEGIRESANPLIRYRYERFRDYYLGEFVYNPVSLNRA